LDTIILTILIISREVTVLTVRMSGQLAYSTPKMSSCLISLLYQTPRMSLHLDLESIWDTSDDEDAEGAKEVEAHKAAAFADDF